MTIFSQTAESLHLTVSWELRGNILSNDQIIYNQFSLAILVPRGFSVH